jgi:hypothetical protein
MDKLQQTGRNLGWVFNFRNGCVNPVDLQCCEIKLTNLKLDILLKQLSGSLSLDIPLTKGTINRLRPLPYLGIMYCVTYIFTMKRMLKLLFFVQLGLNEADTIKPSSVLIYWNQKTEFIHKSVAWCQGD